LKRTRVGPGRRFTLNEPYAALYSNMCVSPRYESTSSEEEEEEEEEEDGSSSEESAEGLDSTEEEEEDGEAALEDETSEEERNVNLDESDTDEETLSAARDAAEEKYDVIGVGAAGAVSSANRKWTMVSRVCVRRFELSSKMREASLTLQSHLNDDITTLKSKEVVRPCMLLQTLLHHPVTRLTFFMQNRNEFKLINSNKCKVKLTTQV